MTIDSQIRDRLHAAVSATTAPPAFAQIAMTRGRARRRRRYAAAGIAAAVVATAGAALLTPNSQVAREGEVANGGRDNADAMIWARSLPAGPAPQLPFFGEGGLHAGDQVLPLPAAVNESIPPRSIAGGWLVMVGQGESDLAYAVLSADGTLTNLPAATYENGLGDTRVAISDDGRRAALGSWVVDLETMALTDLPHAPAPGPEKSGDYYTAIRVEDFIDQGLVYQGAPFEQGLGTTYLLADDGTTTKIEPPVGSHIPDGSPADVAISFDYSNEPDVCVTSYRLVAAAWVEQLTQCKGHDFEAGIISPDGRSLLTDDLNEVWNLKDGGFTRLDAPARLPFQPVWESNDSTLIPVTDPLGGTGEVGPYDQAIQVVRCTLSTGQCERAGDEQEIVVQTDGMDTSGVRFPTS